MGRSIGSGGRINKRSAPTLWNAAFLETFFWDSRASTLEEQALESLFADYEMATSPEKLVYDLRQVSDYDALFKEANGFLIS